MRYFLTIKIILLFFFSGCSSSSITDLEVLKNELKIAEFPASGQYPDADAIILDERHNVTLSFSSNYDLSSNEEITVVKKLFKNIENHAFVEIDIFEGEELLEIEASTIKTNGEIVNLNDEDFYFLEGSGEGSIFYSDKSTVRFTFPAIEKNCIVAFRFIKRKSRVFFRDFWTIQKTIPVLRNSYKLTVPTLLLAPINVGGADWTWDYKFYNIKLEKPNFHKNLNVGKQKRTANVTFAWEQKNIDPLIKEPNMPPFFDVVKYVKFKPHDWQKWSDISKWYYDYFFEPQCIISDPIIQKTNNIVRNEKSFRGKISAIFNYVQKLRYVAIELGTGSISPSLPEKVLEREYGDCKDKSNLLISMLKSQGINAYPVLLRTSDVGSLDDSFPSWNFNHMIVFTEDSKGNEIWLDPTLEYASVGELSHYSEGVTAMIIKDEGKCVMKKTPRSQYLDNYTDISIKLNILEEDHSKYFVQINYAGERNQSLKHYFKDATEKELIEYCKRLISSDFTNIQIDNVQISDIENRYENLVLSFEATIQNSIQRQDDLYFLTVDPFKLDMPMVWLSNDNRRNDIIFNYPFSINKNITITLPKEYRIRNLPENLLNRTSQIYYEINFNNEQDTIVIKENFRLKNKRIPVNNYNETKSIFSKINAKSKEKLVFLKK